MKRFKSYTQNQLSLFPLDIGQLINDGHLVRVINTFVDQLSIEVLSKPFKKEGKPPFHPTLMMKILLYAYSTKLYSSRKIEKAVRQDITFMWLTGMQTPDHNTINRFRSYYFQSIIEDVFTDLLDYLSEQGYIRFETYFVDGTKLEADANKYSYVWKKNTIRYKSNLKAKVQELLREIHELNADEDIKYENQSLEELGDNTDIDSEELKLIVSELNSKLEQQAPAKTQRSTKSRVKKLSKAAKKLEKYEKQENILGKRNSYSKTDTDATFMRMKDDELRAGYNPQVSSENQFVVNYTVSQNAADTAAFPEHLTKIRERGEKYIPGNYVGDAGYGSEENYENLERDRITNYLKYNSFYIENKQKQKNPFHKDNMLYDTEGDFFVCPAGKKILYRHDDETTTDNGYTSQVRVYECASCEGCSLKEKCTKAKGNRRILVRTKLETYRGQARDNLRSEKGIEFRKKRGPEIETFFGDLKMNQGYKRFRLRGKNKVNTELGWLCITYNLRKLHLKINKMEN